MKKCLICAVLLLLSITLYSVVCFAADEHDGETITKDSDGNIEITRTFSEEEIIEELDNKSYSALKKMGYTTSQINYIRKFSGDHPTRKFGTLTYTIKSYDNGYYYKNGKTYLKTKFSWEWSQTPVFVLTDYPAVTTSENFAKYGDDSSAKVYYYKGGVKRSDYKVTRSVDTNADVYGSYLNVSMKKKIDSKTYYALGGYMITYWRASGNIKCVGIYANYGHKIVSGSVSVGFGGKSGSISFTPESKVEHGLPADINVER